MRLGPLNVSWPRTAARESDPYWDDFINRPAADPANMVTTVIRGIQEGSVFQTRADIHTPEVMSEQIKDLGLYVGAAAVGIVALDGHASEQPFAVISLVRAEYDPRVHPGVGGKAAEAEGLYVSFILASYIRELGFHATSRTWEETPTSDVEHMAVAAGLGALDSAGRLRTRRWGTRIYATNAVLTDLPLKPDGSYPRE